MEKEELPLLEVDSIGDGFATTLEVKLRIYHQASDFFKNFFQSFVTFSPA